jgi:antitoxin VapB
VSLKIKDPKAHQVAPAISRATGKSMTSVVKEALRERYAQIEQAASLRNISHSGVRRAR